MRIVVDTNCLIQSIGFRSNYRVVWDAFLAGKYTMCVSNEILDEYYEILQRLFRPAFAETVINAIVESPYVEFVNPYFNFNMIAADPDDNKFVDCAICANAKYLVTNDRHYDILKEIPFPKVDIISLQEFAETIHKL